MAEKKWRIDRTIFRERLNATLKTYEKLADKAKVSPGTITNALHAGCRYETIEIIAKRGLEMGEEWQIILVESDRIRLNGAAPKGVYPVTWEQFATGAEEVGRRLFCEYKVNTLLTFPGPSLVFAGLMMAKALTQNEIIRVPVYTAMFVDKNTASNDLAHFDAIPMERFTILIPRALVQHIPGRELRIGVVDDAVLTGKTMDALRTYFSSLTQKPECLEFACYVCHDGRTLLPETTPISKCARGEKIFRMPWGDAFAFEHCFGSEERKHP